jgi:hypothetical protein
MFAMTDTVKSRAKKPGITYNPVLDHRIRTIKKRTTQIAEAQIQRRARFLAWIASSSTVAAGTQRLQNKNRKDPSGNNSQRT